MTGTGNSWRIEAPARVWGISRRNYQVAHKEPSMNLKVAIVFFTVIGGSAVILGWKPHPVQVHRACIASDQECYNVNLNAGCPPTSILNFCTTCTSPQNQKFCNGPPIITECTESTDPNYCGDKYIAFCSVDQCNSYSPTGSGCPGTDCIQ